MVWWSKHRLLALLSLVARGRAESEEIREREVSAHVFLCIGEYFIDSDPEI